MSATCSLRWAAGFPTGWPWTRATFASQSKIVQIDIDRAEIDKNVPTDHHIIGSARRVLTLLNQGMPQYHHEAWKERILPLRQPSAAEDSDHLTPQQVLEVIRRERPRCHRGHGCGPASDVGHQVPAL